ncbi:lipid A deacylase LpxR family protein [Dokdonia sinensis]|uniref:Lipid A deacylase LpxR family protein n=1 Tax=Dokdonia sinensis TaxID=2479847 RepID=A0A3M0GMM1_9FLAO|nr:lipid A deacylase LpxR family protein [Dokdonia sinensis]RMB62873.1 lipid A deacylase LpxR family protein [Dokdonia sinensis]
MRKTLALCVVLFLVQQLMTAQKIDNLISYRDIKSNNYFRFNYDNDYFAASDENYTQGYSFELVAPYFKTNPANYLFYKPQNAEMRYGLAVEHIGFTPDDYQLPEIQEGDRPFAVAIFLKSFIVATDTEKRSRFTSSISIGLMGPAAFGKEMQTGIHKATGNKIPSGWRNQIKNDVVLNYEVGYEKQLARYRDLFSLQASANVKVGTLFTNASIGMNSTVGIINNGFSTITNRNGFKLYAYAQPTVSVVGYDATLQGGLINRDSPYTIASSDVTRVTGQFHYGIVLKTRTLYFEYARSVSTKEITTGSSYKWGGIKIGFTL